MSGVKYAVFIGKLAYPWVKIAAEIFTRVPKMRQK
jgi:hypothetical protein